MDTNYALQVGMKELKNNLKYLYLPPPLNVKPIEIMKKFEDKKGKGSISLEAWIQG